MEQTVIQKIVTKRARDAEYMNFMTNPDVYDGLNSYLNDGWIIKHVLYNDQKENICTIVFEKTITKEKNDEVNKTSNSKYNPNYFAWM